MDRRELAKALMSCGCVRVGTHRLSSGGLSPYYLDLRRLPSFPRVFEEVVEAYLELLRREGASFERVLGVPTAGIPLGVLVAHKLGKPFLYLRRETKDHGTGRLLEGAAGVVREEGGRVEEAAVLVDREEGARELLGREGIRLLSVMTARELLQELYNMGSLSEEEYGEIMRYLEGRKHV
jgi:orotate phosphoribosyltransferase